VKVAIIGCGLIGQKRAKALGDCQLVLCADLVKERAASLAQQYKNCIATTDWHDAIKQPDIDIIIIATLHATLAEIGLEAIHAGKHVFIEKPGARQASEIVPLLDATKNRSMRVKVGFNHRYHRAFRKARELVDTNQLGELMFIRARYGHGGRLGYDKEWRANPLLSGGGELIDQGVHLIDLARWFLGDFTDVQGHAGTYYWNMPVDDNGFLLLKTPKKQVAFLHASSTEWKNLFSFEIYGRQGKIDIQGLGGSYGVERITYYKMLPEMGPPETIAWEYPMADDSWEKEFADFVKCIKKNKPITAGLQDAHAALEIVEKIYRMSGL